MLIAAGCGGNARGGTVPGNTLTIYASAPLNGLDGEIGREVVAGEKLALAQSGGAAGKFALNYTLLDSTDPKTGSWNAPTVAANARKASQDLNTIAYLGEVEPSASAVSVIFLNEAQTLQVSPTDTFAGLTQPEGQGPGEPEKYYPAGNRTYARMVPGDDGQADAIIDWMHGLNLHRLGLIDDNTLYGRGLTQELADRAARAGIDIVGKPLNAPPGNPGKVVAQLKGQNPDAVFYGGAPTDHLASLWGALQAVLPHAQVFLPSALALPSVAAAAGPAAPRLHLSSPALPLRFYGGAGRKFVRDFQARFDGTPGPWAIFGYRAMRATIAAIRAAGPKAQDRQAVIAAFFRHPPRPPDPGFGGYIVQAGHLVFDRVL